MNLLRRIDAHVAAIAAQPGAASLLVFLVALLVRVSFALWLPDEILWIDGQRYVKIAESLLAGQGFGSLAMNKIAVPTQPLVIAAFKALFDGSYTLVRIGFAVLGSATCVLAYRLGSLLFDARSGLLAGLILAVYPLHAYTSALFEVPQTLFVLLATGAFLCLYRFRAARHLGTVLAAGALCGGSALAVPTVLPFLPWVIVWFPMIEPRRSAWVGAIAAFSLGVTVALCPWAIRNYKAYGYPILVNLAGGENFWKANSQTYFQHGKLAVALPCESETEGQDYCAQLAQVQAEAERIGLTENEAIVYADRAAWRGGITYIRENPLRFLQLTGRKLLTLFSPRPDAVSAASTEASTLQLWVSYTTYGPVLILGLIGIAQQRRRWRDLFPVYAYLLTLTALYSVFVPTIRYRLPIDFFLILFAADRLVAALDRNRTGRRGSPNPP